MVNTKKKILVVDDEEYNLLILQEDLEDEGYDVVCVEDGPTALEKLTEISNFDLVLLDRMMPGMDGIEVLKQMKANDALCNIPVIMQTAVAEHSQIVDGIQSGAFYYLTKPYDKEMLLAIVGSALADADILEKTVEKTDELEKRLEKLKLSLATSGFFSTSFKTLSDCKTIAYLVAYTSPEPEKVILGLRELMMNAIEHGNLGITFHEKNRLLLENTWEEEVGRRLELPENKDKEATIELTHSGKNITIVISDQGKGFDWKKYIEFDPGRATSPNGRGIFMANEMSFDTLEYQDNGSKVVCTINT